MTRWEIGDDISALGFATTSCCCSHVPLASGIQCQVQHMWGSDVVCGLSYEVAERE
jgi:hypothetical protein